MAVVCDNDAIVRTFRITGLDGVFRLVPTLDQAVDGDAGDVRPAAGHR
jgi:anti-sigma B factor antagonist